MTVKELIAKLQEMPQELEVVYLSIEWYNLKINKVKLLECNTSPNQVILEA